MLRLVFNVNLHMCMKIYNFSLLENYYEGEKTLPSSEGFISISRFLHSNHPPYAYNKLSRSVKYNNAPG